MAFVSAVASLFVNLVLANMAIVKAVRNTMIVFGLQFVLRGSPLEAVIVAFVVTLPWGIISALVRGDRNMSDTDRIVEAIQEYDAGCLFTLVKLAFALVMGVTRWILSYFIVTIKAVFYLIEYRSMMKGLEL